jgi:NTE family protein
MARADGVFSGGGVKGIAFAGALEAAAEAGYDAWDKLGGTSAGAIAATALAVGYDAAGIRALLEDTDFAALADHGGPAGWVKFLWRRGLTRGRALHEWIRDLLRNAPRPATTFGELENQLWWWGSTSPTAAWS